MLLAAFLDLRPDLEEGARALAGTIGPGVILIRSDASDKGLRGTRVRLDLPSRETGPTHYAEYVALIERTSPDVGTRSRAADILRRLGEAEARVHGVTLNEVHFHEIADWDSVADIILNAWMLERLDIRSASVAALPLGAGRIETRHGQMPVPAPATLEMLKGLVVIDDGIGGERVTPTGAAILSHLSPAIALPDGPHCMSGAGYGLGHRTLTGIANAVRLSLWSEARTAVGMIGVIRFSIDDQTGEDLAVALDRIRRADGVVDVLQFAAFGKKGRMTVRAEVLCDQARLEDIAAMCLSETTTLGVRTSTERRIVLPRTHEVVDGIGVKLVERPDGKFTRKAEMDHLSGIGNHATRQRARHAAESDE
ncbi:hypothetical protein LX81_03969 [Palleronia aestuarii]|uniref:LarC family nickel insertion protein n=2 Tax=Palleronia aestuarii TaxID=568105 RepID=A0A2W7MYS6_9RHOB|nr:hypothetical protein LX81_03969 [Palleronia aestuarii]